MHLETKEFLRHNALSVWRSWQNQEPVGEDERPCLHTAYALIQLLNELPKPASSYELAKKIDLSAHTVFEYMGVLRSGGVPITQQKRRENDVGRPISTFFLERSDRKK